MLSVKNFYLQQGIKQLSPKSFVAYLFAKHFQVSHLIIHNFLTTMNKLINQLCLNPLSGLNFETIITCEVNKKCLIRIRSIVRLFLFSQNCLWLRINCINVIRSALHGRSWCFIGKLAALPKTSWYVMYYVCTNWNNNNENWIECPKINVSTICASIINWINENT